MKIGTKIFFSFLIPSIILTVLGVGALYYFSADNLKKQIDKHLETAAQSRANHVDTVLKMYQQRAKMLASKIWLRKHLKSYLNTGDDEYKIKVEEILADVQTENPNFLHISIINPDGRIIIATHKDSIGNDISNKDFFIKSKKDYIVSGFHEPEYDGSRMHIAGPLIQDGEFLGVVAVASDGKTLENAVADYVGLGETGEVYLINQEGYVITPLRFKEDTFLKEKIDTENTRNCFSAHDSHKINPTGHIKHVGHEAVEIFLNYRGVNVLGAHVYIPEMQWCLLAEINESEALAPVSNLFLLGSATAFIIFVFIFLVAILIGRKIAKPIEKLREGTAIIARGNLNHKVAINSKDEIGRLSHDFDSMTSSLKKTRSNIEKQVAKRTAELEKLNKYMTGRELKMIELKKEIKKLKNKN